MSTLKDCDKKLARYREVLESGVESSTIGRWIAEVEAEKRRLERQLGAKPSNRVMTASEVKALVMRLKDIVAALSHADPALKRQVYDELGVSLTYSPSGAVDIEAGHPHVLRVGVGGGT